MIFAFRRLFDKKKSALKKRIFFELKLNQLIITISSYFSNIFS